MKKKTLFQLLVIVFILAIAGSVCAQGSFSLLNGQVQYNGSDRSLSVLVKDSRRGAETVKTAAMSLNGIALSDVQYSGGDPVTYCFVVDVTPTFINGQRTIAKEIAEALYTGNEDKGDNYILITYADEMVNEPLEGNDPAYLFEDIQFASDNKLKGDYTDALSIAIQKLKDVSSSGLKVIILVTDGNQVSSPALSVAEMSNLLKESGYPLYAVGLEQTEAQMYMDADLKKMEDLAKVSGGLYWRYQQNTDTIVSGIKKAVPSVYSVQGYFQDSDSLDAGTYKLELEFFGDNQKSLGSVSGNVEFSGTNVTVTPGPGPAPESDSNPIVEFLQDLFGDEWKFYTCVCALILILIVFVVIRLTQKPNDNTGYVPIPSGPGGTMIQNSGMQIGGTSIEPPVIDVPLSGMTPHIPTNVTVGTLSGGTTPGMPTTPTMPQERDVPKAHVILTNKRTKRSCDAIIPEGETVMFGRFDPDSPSSIQVLDSNGSVSRKHFSLTFDTGALKLRDEASANGTRVNGGAKVRGYVRVNSEDIIMAGEEEFRLTFSVINRGSRMSGVSSPKNNGTGMTELI